jgi:hypothetical protein
VQLTTDGFRAYKDAVDGAFGMEVDYATLVKVYGAPTQDDTKYSPAEIVDIRIILITGNPDMRFISMSHIESRI